MKQAKIFLVFLTIGLFLLFLLPPTDPDLGWHLRCGQEFWRKQSFCSQNQFSVLLPKIFWTNHYWLYQSIIYPVFKLTGLWGLTIFNAFLLTLTFVFFYLAIKNFVLEKILAISLIIFLSWGTFSLGLRSQLFSFFFFSLVLLFSTKLRQNPTRAVFYPLIILLWANTHGGSVVLGLLLISFVFLSFIINNRTGLKQIIFFVLVWLFSFGATLLNPFGLAIYQEAWRHFAGVNLSQLIAEWVPPVPFIWWLILLSTLGLFILLVAAGVKNLIFAFLLLLLGFLALKARRHVPFLFILEFFLLFNQFLLFKKISQSMAKKVPAEILTMALIFLFLFFGLFLRLPLTVHTNLSWQNYCQNSTLVYPCKAVDFLKSQPEKGPIFNRYEWGGFLIWQLPEFKIFVDGRMPAWPTPENKSPYTIYLETLQTQPGWQETLKNYNISWILISPGTFMDLLIRPSPEKFGWQEVYRDKTAVIYKKS